MPPSASRGHNGLAWPLLVAGAVVIGDQITKVAASASLGRDASTHRVELLGSVIAFEYLENTGAAFGVLRGQGILLTLVAGLVVGLLVTHYLRSGQSSVVLGTSVGLLMGGALGNVVDRVRLGYVVDFIAVGAWPKFNLADSAVTVGVVLLAWSMIQAGDVSDHTRTENSTERETSETLSGGSVHRRQAVRYDGG